MSDDGETTHGDQPSDESRRAGVTALPGARGRIRAAQRIWLHDDGKPTFGPGTLRLLVLVTQTGSLHQAAKKTGMAYSKAWRIVKNAEEHLDVKLLERHIGGSAGGGSALTPDGQRLVAGFVAMRAEAEQSLQLLFLKYFGDEPFARPPGAE